MIPILLLAFLGFSSGHGVITELTSSGQTACAVHTGGCTPTNNLHLREIIPRSGNTGECALPPGCEADFICDHCGLEKVALGSALSSSKWWTSMPAVNWDEDITQPVFPCMTYDDFGAQGTMAVSPGDEISYTFYVNADHSGLYRFELSCGETAANADFHANPITPWKALHEDKEGVELGASREVGSTRADTDAYFLGTTCTGAACAYRMNRDIQGATSSHCTSNPADCFVTGSFSIPADTACQGSGILRWKWNSAEGSEVYANCLDLTFSGTGNEGVEGDTGVDAVPQNPSNTGACFEGESCSDTPTCCPVGQGCYKKDDYWAACRAECVPGSIDPTDPLEYQTPWECVLLGGDPEAQATNIEDSDGDGDMNQASSSTVGVLALVSAVLAAFAL